MKRIILLTLIMMTQQGFASWQTLLAKAGVDPQVIKHVEINPTLQRHEIVTLNQKAIDVAQANPEEVKGFWKAMHGGQKHEHVKNHIQSDYERIIKTLRSYGFDPKHADLSAYYRHILCQFDPSFPKVDKPQKIYPEVQESEGFFKILAIQGHMALLQCTQSPSSNGLPIPGGLVRISLHSIHHSAANPLAVDQFLIFKDNAYTAHPDVNLRQLLVDRVF